MNAFRLGKLLSRYEGPKLDFKAQLKLNTNSDKKELTKDVIAIANSSGGRGYIIFGVEDKSKKVVGINPNDFNEEQIQQILCRRISPSPAVGIDVVDYQDKKVAVLSIFKSNQGPHQMVQTGAFYIRRGSTTDFASREEIASMLQMNGLYSYESTIIKHASMKELDYTVLRKYLSAIGVKGIKPSKVILESLGFIAYDEYSDKYKPTVGGIILFGKNPSKFLPHLYIKIINEGKPKYFFGSIPKLLENVEEYLKEVLPSDYSFDGLFQAIDNAIVHRDYTDISRGIVISINEKNIVVSNPGALLPGNLIYKIEQDNNTRKRNPWLYQRLMIMGDSSRFSREGMGIKKIKKQFENVKFFNIGSQNIFKVILPRIIEQ